MIKEEVTGMNIINEIQERLFEFKDDKYQEFQCKLMPTVSPEVVIGVRTPDIRKLGKEYAKHQEIGDFLRELPHKYYEEYNLHSSIIASIKDYDTCVEEVKRFLPYVDNWATCDMMTPKCFKKNLSELMNEIKIWITAEDTYTVRFGIRMIMCFFLDDEFDKSYLDMVALVKSEEYYINMMIAWFFATALAKQYEATITYIEQNILDKWTHNKTIQKAVESYRITDEQKLYLKGLKVK